MRPVLLTTWSIESLFVFAEVTRLDVVGPSQGDGVSSCFLVLWLLRHSTPAARDCRTHPCHETNLAVAQFSEVPTEGREIRENWSHGRP